MSSRQQGRIALVTGGAQGLGFGIVQGLLSEGATVHIWDNNPEKISQSKNLLATDISNGRVFISDTDITNEAAVEAGFSAIVDAHGQIDAVVNSAGIVGPNGKDFGIGNITVADFQRVQNINVLGSFLVCRGAVRRMTPAGFGRIVLIASIAGLEGNPFMCPYTTSKGAVIAMVKGIGKEVATTGLNITVNGIAPVTVMTEMVQAMDPTAVAYMKSKIPAGRLAAIEEVVHCALNLLDPANTYNNGFLADVSLARRCQ